MADAQHIIQRQSELERNRSNHAAVWTEIRELIVPDASQFLGETITRGAKTRRRIYDGTGEYAADILAAGLHHMLTNPTVPWQSLTVSDPKLKRRDSVRRWLGEASEVLFGIFNKPETRFQPEAHEVYQDLGALGTGIMFIEETRSGYPLFSARPMGECYAAEGEAGVVDTLYRKFSLSARQAVIRYGAEALTDEIRAKAQGKDADTADIEFIHAVEPRLERDEKQPDARNMAFSSCHVLVNGGKVVKESGFQEFPYAVPRWSVRTGEIYGRGPGRKALADVKELQEVSKVTRRGFAKAIDPPLMAVDDGVLGRINVNPSAINHVRQEHMRQQGDPIRPINTGARPDLGLRYMEDRRTLIERAFYVDLFKFAREPHMTATQVLQITEQTMMVLNPILGRLQVEYLAPLVDRTFMIALRNGLIPPPPAELEGIEYSVEFVSPTAKLQRISQARAVSQHIETNLPLIQADPSLMDNYDGDATMRGTGEIIGVPERFFRTPQAVSELRAQRQQMQEAAQAAELAKSAGAAAKDFAQAGAATNAR